jgi:Family of unknown function (DUF5681)
VLLPRQQAKLARWKPHRTATSRTIVAAISLRQLEDSAELIKIKPGESGNPSGRPREPAELKARARQHTATALETLVKVMTSEKATTSAKVAAARALLDRGYGRPESSVNAQIQQTTAQFNEAALSPDELAEAHRLSGLFASLLAKMTGGSAN